MNLRYPVHPGGDTEVLQETTVTFNCKCIIMEKAIEHQLSVLPTKKYVTAVIVVLLHYILLAIEDKLIKQLLFEEDTTLSAIPCSWMTTSLYQWAW